VKHAVHPFPRFRRRSRGRKVARKGGFSRGSTLHRSIAYRGYGCPFAGIGGRRRSHVPLAVWLGRRKAVERRDDAEARGRTRAGRS
jgi:hypothetical protein